MLAKYAKKFGLEDINLSDIEINDQLQRESQANNADNAFIDTRYKITKVKQQVNYCKFLINILGWIFIVFGSIGVILNFMGFIFFNPKVYEVRGPRQSYKNFEYPYMFHIINLTLDALSNASTIYLGVCCRKFSGIPTRTDTWSLCKKAIYIALIQSLFLILKYFCELMAISYIITQWEETSFKDAGNYIIRNRSTGKEYRYHKPKTTTTISQEFEKEDKQQAGQFFISIALTSFFMSFCCLSIYCAITIISLYKFHDTAKELSIIEEFSAIRIMNVERQENKNARVSQYRPAPSVAVARDSIAVQSLNP